MEARSVLSICGAVFLAFCRVCFWGDGFWSTGESTAIFCVKIAGCCCADTGAVLAEAGLGG